MPEATPIRRKLMTKVTIAGQRHRRWEIELAEDQTIKDVQQSYFWADQAETLMGHDQNAPRALGDIIEVRQANTGLYAEVIVREIGKGFIRVDVLRNQQAAPVEIPETSPLTTKWNVGKQCHEVIRKIDKQPMASGFQTKQKAADWIAEHIKVMAA